MGSAGFGDGVSRALATVTRQGSSLSCALQIQPPSSSEYPGNFGTRCLQLSRNDGSI